MPASRNTARGWLGCRVALSLAALAPPVLVFLVSALGSGLAAAARGSEPLVVLGVQPGESRRVITHDEWAADLAGALGLSQALSDPSNLRSRADAEKLFALLCPERAERVTDAGGLRVPTRSPFSVAVDASGRDDPGAPFRATVTVPAAALYLLAVEGVGAQRWTLDKRPVGHLDPSALGVAHAPAIVPLRAGPHELAAYLSPRARVDRVELTAYRPLCLAPAEGWRSGRPLTAGAMARTLVQALGLERNLPAQGEAIHIEGEAFGEASAWGERTTRRLSVPALGDAWVTASGSPAEFDYRVHLDDPGVFTLYARVHGAAPQIWSIDGRHRVTLLPGTRAATFAWSHVLTLPLAAGEHALRALVARDSGVDALRLVRRRSSDADYLALAEREGIAGNVRRRLVTHAVARASLSSPRFVRRMQGPNSAGGLFRSFAGDPAEIPFELVDSPPAGIAPPPPLPPPLPSEL